MTALPAAAAPHTEPRTQQETILLESQPVSHWQKQLQSADWLDRWQAAYALGTLGKDGAEAIPALVDALKDKDERVQAGAAASLGKIGEPAHAALEQLLRNGERRQRRWAAYALGRTGDLSVAPLLVMASGDSRDDVREKAAESLELLGFTGKDALRVFIKGLKDTNPAVRFHSVRALGNIADASAVPALIEILDDSNINIRAVACEALGKIGPASSKAVPKLIALLSNHPFVQAFAVTSLGGIGPGAADALGPLKALAAPGGSDSIRRKAQWAIGKIEAPSDSSGADSGGESAGAAAKP